MSRTPELLASLYAFDLVQKRAKRPAGAPDRSLARPVTKVGIVGAGLMASQLALLFVRRLEVPVVLTDLDQARVDKGVGYVHAEVDKLLAKGRVNADKANRLKGLVTGSVDKAARSRDADFVIEAVFEEMSVKKSVFADVEKVVRPSACWPPTPPRCRSPRWRPTWSTPSGSWLPLLQPGRGDAAARDRPGRADRRRHAGHGVRHRQDAEEDHDPGQGQPRRSSSTGCSAGSWARSAGSSTRAPR